jgi:hypothetical protein
VIFTVPGWQKTFADFGEKKGKLPITVEILKDYSSGEP